jgi:hypothetical protein
MTATLTPSAPAPNPPRARRGGRSRETVLFLVASRSTRRRAAVAQIESPTLLISAGETEERDFNLIYDKAATGTSRPSPRSTTTRCADQKRDTSCP